MAEVAYDEYDHRLVPSNHGPGIHYRVFFGCVNWQRVPQSVMRPTYIVFLQHGGMEDWADAVRDRELDLTAPALILAEDLDRVLEAIQAMKAQHPSVTRPI